jgi:hypothetical protein
MGGGPARGPLPDTNETNGTTGAEGSFYAMDLNVGPALKLDRASRAIIELGRRIDVRNAERDCVAALLGELARCANTRGRLDAGTASAFKIVAESVDVSPQRLRAAVADAIDGEAPA